MAFPDGLIVSCAINDSNLEGKMKSAPDWVHSIQSTKTEKCCGNCKWWNREEIEDEVAWCTCNDENVPRYAHDDGCTWNYQGEDCPCHTPIQQGENE